MSLNLPTMYLYLALELAINYSSLLHAKLVMSILWFLNKDFGLPCVGLTQLKMMYNKASWNILIKLILLVLMNVKP